MAITDHKINDNLKYLGDRTLTLFVGRGFYHFTTYTYTNLNGGGNAN